MLCLWALRMCCWEHLKCSNLYFEETFDCSIPPINLASRSVQYVWTFIQAFTFSSLGYDDFSVICCLSFAEYFVILSGTISKIKLKIEFILQNVDKFHIWFVIYKVHASEVTVKLVLLLYFDQLLLFIFYACCCVMAKSWWRND